MIKLYRPSQCPGCADIEAALQEMVVAHQVVVVKAGQTPNELNPAVPLPAIQDNGQIISGPGAISRYLQELQKFVADWQRFQSDSCYLDDEGQSC
jgi:glutathione S-transferase